MCERGRGSWDGKTVWERRWEFELVVSKVDRSVMGNERLCMICEAWVRYLGTCAYADVHVDVQLMLHGYVCNWSLFCTGFVSACVHLCIYWVVFW